VPDAAEFDAMNGPVIAEFRKTGKSSGIAECNPLVLVHHVGAKSGTERIAPLVPYLDGDRVARDGQTAHDGKVAGATPGSCNSPHIESS
jgi:hypothetical protein